MFPHALRRSAERVQVSELITYVNEVWRESALFEHGCTSGWGVKMLRESDRTYHECRARDELERAEEANDPAIAQVHRELAALHRRRIIESVGDERLQLQQAEFELTREQLG